MTTFSFILRSITSRATSFTTENGSPFVVRLAQKTTAWLVLSTQLLSFGLNAVYAEEIAQVIEPSAEQTVTIDEPSSDEIVSESDVSENIETTPAENPAEETVEPETAADEETAPESSTTEETIPETTEPAAEEDAAIPSESEDPTTAEEETPSETTAEVTSETEKITDMKTTEASELALDETLVIESTLHTNPAVVVSGNDVHIKLSDWDFPGKQEGDELTDSEALSVIMGLTTKKKDIAQIMLNTIDAAPLPENINPEIAQKVEAIYENAATIDAGETINALADELITDENAIGNYVDVSTEGKGKTINIDAGDIEFISGSLIMSFPMRDAAPGIYTVSGSLKNPLTGEIEYFSQDFVWGVLAINADKDVYGTGEVGHLAIGILNNAGKPLCDASAQLIVIAPDSSEQTVTVQSSDTCKILNPANRIPDYSADIAFGSEGIYTLRLMVDNGSGTKVFEKNITVSNAPRFTIERNIATRLYPVGSSPATVSVVFNENFSGTITELLPTDFAVIGSSATLNGNAVNLSVGNSDGQKTLSAQVTANAGDVLTLEYTYDAPDISPMYYTLGPVVLDNGSEIYTEQQVWGIANDAPSDDFVTTWKTDNAGTSNSTSITVPAIGGTYNYDVDWNNDGTFDEFGITGPITHDFGVAGTYTIRIQGAYPRIGFGYGGDAKKLISVDQWGSQAWTSFDGAFATTSNLTIAASDVPDLSGVTAMTYMFYGATGLTGDFSGWDTSTITNMTGMFQGATGFNSDIGAWDVSSVTNMSSMFSGASSFNQDISGWVTSSVTNMNSMFSTATAFNQPIGSWDTSSVTDTGYMFYAANSFNQDISSWDVSNVTNMGLMFASNTSFDTSIDAWDVSSVTNMTSMFSGSHYNQPLNSWDVSSVTNMNSMFSTAWFNQPLDNWNTINVTNMGSMFFASAFNQPIGSWDTGNVTNMSGMFQNSTVFNQPIGTWNTSNVTNMSTMFGSASVFNQNISAWNTGNVTTMANMFQNAAAFNQPIGTWNTSSVTTMFYMFIGATSFDQNIGNWDITQVTTMSDMFTSVTLSTANYDAILNGWGAQVAKNNVPFSGGLSKFCSGLPGRVSLTGTYSWTITDGGYDCGVTGFKTTWQTTTPNEQITIPTGTGVFNYNVSWGDGTYSAGLTTSASHTYTSAGTYTVEISGTFPHLFINSSADKDKILAVTQWGTQQWESMDRTFFGCTNLNITASDAPDLSNVTNMNAMFSGATSMNSTNLNTWDMSNVTDTSYMFNNATGFNQSLNNWNVSNITDMQAMFNGATTFNGNITSWDVSNVTNMYQMFAFTDAFNQPINSWDITSVTDLRSMFAFATAFNQPLSDWDTHNITDFTGLFFGSAFNQPLTTVGNKWNTSNVLRTDYMFQDNTVFNQDISSWNMGNVTSMWQMFRGATAFNQDISSWNTVLVSDMSNMFMSATSFDQNIGPWNIVNVTNMAGMFNGVTLSTANYDAILTAWSGQTVLANVPFDAGNSTYCTASAQRGMLTGIYNWTITDGGQNCGASAFITTWKTDNAGTSASNEITIPTNGGGYNYDVDWGDGNTDTGVTGDITHSYAVAGTYTVKISGTFPSIYFNNGGDKEKILSVDQWGVQVWTSMANAFYGASNLTIAATDAPVLTAVSDMSYMFSGATSMNSDLSGWDTSNVTNMEAMFNVATAFNQDISSWNVSNVTNMAAMFANATSFNQPLNAWNTGNVTSMVAMFANATAFDQDISSWNVSNVTNMNYMFANATAFNQNINTWNTGMVTNMTAMFQNAVAFNQPLNAWNTGSVISMSHTFDGAVSFDQPLNAWNVSNVINMSEMFSLATAFNQPLNTWNTSSVTSMANMFINATAFNQDISSWNTGNVIGMNGMFHGATMFNQDISSWNTGNVTNMFRMFNSATAFNQDISSWNTGNVTTMEGMFQNATSFNQNIGSWNVANVTNMTDMFNGVTLSTNNYDSILIGWQAQTLQTNVSFHGGSSKYCTAIGQRLLITSISNWTITDGGFDCSASAFTFTVKTDNAGTSGNNQFTIPTTGAGYNYTVDWGDGNVTVGETGDATHTYASAGTYTVQISGTFPRIYFNNGGDRQKILAITQWGTNVWSSMANAFHGASNLTITAADTPDLSGTTTTFRMFSGATSLNSSLDSWDVSSITNMAYMFNGATVFNSALNNWNVGNVTTMEGMFGDAVAFNQPLNNWNTINVTNMGSMFAGANAFNQDISSWNVSSVASMAYMFVNTPFNQDISSWNVSGLTNANGMFEFTTVFNQPLNAWNVSNVTNMSEMFYGATAFNQPLNAWNTGSVTNMNYMFGGGSIFNQPIGLWNTGNVTNMSYMFFNDTAFNQDISSWNVSSVTTMESMFKGATAFNQPLNTWNTGSVTNMSSMFQNATSFNQNIGSWDVADVTNMGNMFLGDTLSTVNYDALLTGWAAQTVQSNVAFHGGSSIYCAVTDHNTLTTAPNSWAITDGGVCDLIPPTITNVTSSTGNGTKITGDTVSIQIEFDEDVNVVTTGGTPTLTLETGTVDTTAIYTSGTGTDTLTFTYTVVSGDTSSDLDYVNTAALSLNGGTIKDLAGNNGTLTLATPGTVGSLGANKAIIIDTTGPSITNITSSTANGYYKAGDVISLQVLFDENAVVTGTPRITLETGATDAVVNYASGSGTTTLTFTYTVASGENSADLDYQSIAALALNGGTIKDAAGNNANIVPLATPGTAGSLGANKNIIVDTTAPTAPTDGDLAAASDSGTSNTDDITSDTTPTLNGTGTEANAVVKIYDGVTLVCTTTADGTGAWSCTTSVLTNGTHTLKVSQTDLAGNESAQSTGLSVVIDNSVATGSYSTAAFITNNVAPHTITFTLDDGAVGGGITADTDITVNDSVSGALTPSCIAAGGFPTTGNSLITCTVDISGEGTHVLNATVTDKAGNVGIITSTASYVFDFTPPVFTYLAVDPVTSTPSDFTDPELTFLATDTVALDRYEVQVNGGAYTVQTSPYVILASDVSLNTVNVKAFDTAGNMTLNTVKFYPSVIITSPTTISNTGINDTTLQVVGPYDITGVTATIDGVPVTLSCPDLAANDNDITCTIVGGIPSGGVLAVSATDGVVTGSTSTQSYILDTTPAVITPTVPTVISQNTITDSSFVITDANGIYLVTFTGVANTLTCVPLAPTAAVSMTCTGSISASGTLTVNVTDTAGNTSSATQAYIVDNVAPTISALTPAAGLFKATQNVTFTVQDTNAGIIPGNVVITGGTSPSCSAVDAYNVSCSVSVPTTDTISISATDGAGNIATSGPHTYTIDTIPPTVSNVTSSTTNGLYKIGDTISIQVVWSETVNVDTTGGTPTLLLETGMTDRTATYVSGTGTDTLTFNYTIQAGDENSDLDYQSTAALILNGGTIMDPATNDATLTLATPGTAGSLGTSKSLDVDGVVPTVTNVSSPHANGTFNTVGTVFNIEVSFSEPVNVTGTPQLTLETGTTDTTINYASGSGTNTLTFVYTVAVNQDSTDLDYTATNALTLNGGTIKDIATNDGTLTLAAPGTAGSISANKAIYIDTTLPTVTNVTSSTANGYRKLGDTVSVQVVFSEPVYTTGTPQLTLETGTTDRTANYASGSGTNTLTFTYTVQAGDESTDLDYTATNALALNGGSIYDIANNDATLTLVAPAAAGSLGANKALVIDGIVPTFAMQFYSDVGLTTTIANNAVLKAGTYYVKISASEALGSTPTMSIVAEGTANDINNDATTLISGNDYLYIYTISSDVAAVGVVIANFSVTGTDLAGNTETNVDLTNEATKAIYTDTVAPSTLSTPDMTAGSDTGSSSTDDNTADTTPSFTGACVTNDTIKLYDGVTLLGTATCTGSVYVVTSSILLDGAYSVHVTATDPAGNVSLDSATLSITIDTTAPSAPGTAPDLDSASDTGSSNTDNITNDTTPTFTGTCTTGELVKLYRGGVATGDSFTCVASAYTVTNTSVLTDAAYLFTTTFTDLAGNESTASPTLSVTIDTTADAAPGTPDMTAGTDSGSSSIDNITNDTTPDFTVSCVTGSTITLYSGVTSIGTGICAGGTVTITATSFADGTYNSIHATQTDTAGNISAVSSNMSVTIDTTAPTTPAIAPDLAVGSDTGSSNTDNNTSDTTPTFSGSCTTGDIVKLYDSTPTLLATATCAASVYVITSSALTDAAYSMHVTFTDPAGNVSGDSPSLSVTIDTTADAAPGTPDMTAGTDTGSSNTDNNTSDTTPDFTISCVTGSTVTLYNNITSIGTGTCAGSTVTITASALIDGTYTTINAKQTDTAGNVSVASGNLSITIDTTAPSAPGTAPDLDSASDTGSSNTDNNTSDTTPTFTGTCTTGELVKLYRGGVATGDSYTCAGGTYTVTNTSVLTDGTYSFTTTFTDPAGNESAASPALSVTIDVSAPAQTSVPDLNTGSDTGSSSTDNITADTTPSITLTCETGATVTITDGTNNYSGTCVAGTVTITVSPAITDGTYNYTATQTDTAGNTSTSIGTLSITIDTTAPSAPGTAPDMNTGSDTGISSTDDITSDTTPTFSGTCTTGELVKLYRGGVATGDSFTCVAGAYTITNIGALADAFYLFTTTFTDPAGNESAASPSISVVIDTTADAATGTPDMTSATDTGSSNSDDLTNDITPDFTVSCVTGSTVTLYDNLTIIGTGTCAGSTVTITASTLTAGTHASIYTTQTDAAGNVSVASGNLSITIDTTAPTAPTVASISGDTTAPYISTDTTPDIIVDTTIGDTVTITGWTCTPSPAIGLTVTCTPNAPLAEGNNTINITITDPAGNATTTTGVSFTVDSIPPVLTTATINGSTITLTYSETLDPLSLPATTDYVLSGGQTVTSVAIGANNQIVLTISPSVTSSSSVSISYTPGLTPTQDTTGNDAVALVGQSLSNTTPAASSGGGGGGSGSYRPKTPKVECTLNSSGNYYRKTDPNTVLNTFQDFSANLASEGFISQQARDEDYEYTKLTLRKEALGIAVKMKRVKGEDIPFVSVDKYQKIYTDIDYSVPTSWIPAIVETGLAYNIITPKRMKFDSDRAITRAEAYGMIMKSVCMPIPVIENTDWQKSVYDSAQLNGLTVRTWSDFAPNREILRQEMFVIAARAADWAEETGGCNPKPAQCK